MLEEQPFLVSLHFLQVLFPLGLEELQELNTHSLGVGLLEILKAREAFMEGGVVDFTG